MESGGESGTEDTEGTGATGQAFNTELLTQARRQRRAACSCPPPRYARQELSDERGYKQDGQRCLLVSALVRELLWAGRRPASGQLAIAASSPFASVPPGLRF